MIQNNLTIKYELHAQVDEDNVTLSLELAHQTQLRARLSGNGVTNNMIMQVKDATEPYSAFLATDPEKLAALFDPTFTLANKIDSQWLVERLLKQREETNADEALVARIKGLTVVSNLMGLHAVGNDVMNALYGYNWVAEQTAGLVKQSKAWLELIERVKFIQQALKDSLPS